MSSSSVENKTRSQTSVESARSKEKLNRQSVDKITKQPPTPSQLSTSQTTRLSGLSPSTNASRSVSQNDLVIKDNGLPESLNASLNKQRKKTHLPTSARAVAATGSKMSESSTEVPELTSQQPNDGSQTANGNHTSRQRGQGLSSRSNKATPRHYGDGQKSATDGRKSAADGRVTSRTSSRQSMFRYSFLAPSISHSSFIGL